MKKLMNHSGLLLSLKKERQALEDIFGNMASCHLRDIMGSTKLEHFVLDFYKTVNLEN